MMELIEDAYKQLEELPIEFDRKDVERILFERAMRQLEAEEAKINQASIRGRYYDLLSKMVMKLECQDYQKDLIYVLEGNKEKSNFTLRNRQTWVPDNF